MAALAEHNVGSLEELSDVQLIHLIARDWSPVWFGAKPYLEALLDLAYAGNGLGAAYYADAPGSVPLYFLSNAATWKGETARAVKAELKRRVK